MTKLPIERCIEVVLATFGALGLHPVPKTPS
jgi:hypothetical protein